MSFGEQQFPGGPAAAPQALDWLNGDVAALRTDYEKTRAKPIPPNARWIFVEAAGRAIGVLAHPASRAGNISIVYFHGGGFIVGSPLTHADITGALCRQADLPLYSVDYRLSPDHNAPAQVDDGVAVINHLSNAGFTRFVLCGDSAGGAIALALEAAAPADMRAKIRGVCSMYGAYAQLDTPSLRAKGSRADGTDSACIERYFNLAGGWDAYCLAALAKPSPVPVLIVGAGADPLLDQSLMLSRMLRQHKRDVTLNVVDAVGHGFLHQAGRTGSADTALRDVATWMQNIAQ